MFGDNFFVYPAAISVEVQSAETILSFTRRTMEIPNYQTLKTLPSGSTISLFNDKKKIYNVADGEIQTKILKPQNTDLTWNNLIEDDKTYWFTMVTKDEYNSMLDSNNVINEFPGTMRDHNAWQQLIFVPTVEEAINGCLPHV